MRIRLLTAFILPAFFCGAQQKETDSMLAALNKYPAADTTRLKLLSDISYNYYQLDPDKGIEYANQIILLAQKLKDSSWLAMGFARLGLNYSEKGLSSEALGYYRKAAAIFEAKHDEAKLFGVRNSTAIVYMEMSEFSVALDMYLKNLRYCEKEKKQKGVAMTAGNIALVYKRMNDNARALAYNQQAIDIYKNMNDNRGLADALNSRGNIFDNMGDSRKAVPFYRASLSVSEKIDYTKGVVSAGSNLGNVFAEQGVYDSALYYIKSTFPFYEKTGDKSNMAVLYQYWGNVIIKASDAQLVKEGIDPAKRYEAANGFYKKSLQLDIETEDIAGQAENWQAISNSYKLMKRFDSALDAHEKYADLKDSILSDEKIEAIRQSEMHYAVKKNEDSLLLIQESKDIVALSEINRQRTIQRSVTLGGAAILLAAFISFIFYKKRRDAKQQQQEAEFKSEVAGTEMKALRAQMNPHFIFNSLNSIGDYITKNNTQEAGKYLGKFAKLMRMILENSEQKEVPIADDLKALELYMQLEAVRMNNKFTYEIKTSETIDREATLIPPLILQPFVENSIWHGIAPKEGSGKISIYIQKEAGEMINCIVEDDGIGRKRSGDSKRAGPHQQGSSLGLKITQARIDVLNKIKNAKAEITVTDLAQGTRVEVKLPLSTRY